MKIKLYINLKRSYSFYKVYYLRLIFKYLKKQKILKPGFNTISGKSNLYKLNTLVLFRKIPNYCNFTGRTRSVLIYTGLNR